jgi:hypothetical protein
VRRLYIPFARGVSNPMQPATVFFQRVLKASHQTLSTPKKYSPHHQQLTKIASRFFTPPPNPKMLQFCRNPLVNRGLRQANFKNAPSQYMRGSFSEKEPLVSSTRRRFRLTVSNTNYRQPRGASVSASSKFVKFVSQTTDSTAPRRLGVWSFSGAWCSCPPKCF